MSGDCKLGVRAIAKIALFEGVPQQELERLAPRLFHKSFPARSTLMSFDQRGEAVYVILQGTVKVHVERPSGSDVVIAILGPGELVGEMSLLDGRGRSASVTSLEKTECLWMDAPEFRDTLRMVPQVGYNFARIMAARIRLANDQIQSLAALDVESRVASQIVALADRYGKPCDAGILIPLRLTQSDISGMIAASREQTNKVLVSYRNRGYIEVARDHRITILKPDLLRRRAVQFF